MRLLLLISSCVLLWLVLAGPVFLWLGGQHLLYSAVAAGICLVPTSGTLLWCDLVLGKSPEQQLAAVMGGTAFRMVFVVGLGMVLYGCVPGFASASFWLWIIGFYLAALGVEVFLLTRRQTTTDRASYPDTPV